LFDKIKNHFVSLYIFLCIMTHLTNLSGLTVRRGSEEGSEEEGKRGGEAGGEARRRGEVRRRRSERTKEPMTSPPSFLLFLGSTYNLG
jgi:hypothetical protein